MNGMELVVVAECVYCGVESALLPRRCCKEGWYFDSLYAICAPFYDQLEGRLFNRGYVDHLMYALKHQLQNFCDEQDISIEGYVDCTLGTLCQFQLQPRSLSPPRPSDWLPDERQRRMIWNDVTVRRLGGR